MLCVAGLRAGQNAWPGDAGRGSGSAGGALGRAPQPPQPPAAPVRPPGFSAETAAGDGYVTPTGSPARAPRAGDCHTYPAEINGVPGRPRCQAAQPEKCQLRAAPQSIGSDYGAKRLGQVFPRL